MEGSFGMRQREEELWVDLGRGEDYGQEKYRYFYWLDNSGRFLQKVVYKVILYGVFMLIIFILKLEKSFWYCLFEKNDKF